MFPESVQRGFGQPFARLLECFFTSRHLFPVHLALPAICLFNRRIKHPNGCAPDIRADAIADNEGDSYLVRNDKCAVIQFCYTVCCHTLILFVFAKYVAYALPYTPE